MTTHAQAQGSAGRAGLCTRNACVNCRNGLATSGPHALNQRLSNHYRSPAHGLPHADVSGLFQASVAPLVEAQPGIGAGFGLTSLVYLLGIRVLLSGLTPAGVASSWLLGGSVFSAFGGGGFALVCVYFLAGSAVTRFKLREKEAAGIAEQRSGRRGVASVVGSGSAGIVCAVLALAVGHQRIFQTAFAASFISKLSDTVSSEVGKGYGKRTYSLLSLQAVKPGTEGAVSLEGTAGGIGAAVLYASLAFAIGQVDARGAAICALAATVANIVESYIGALAQGRVAWLTNDVVNVIQICLAAALAATAQALLSG